MADALEPYGPVPDTTVRVATWNVWSRFGPWEARRPIIESELVRVDADIICLQEAWVADDTTQGAQLGDQLGLHVHQAGELVYEDIVSGQAILSRWPMTRIERLDVSGFDEGEGTTAAYARVEGPRGAIDVVSLILDSGLWYSALRRRQLEVILAWVKDLGDRMTPLVLAGDFNASQHSDELRALVGLAPPLVEKMVFYDAMSVAGDADASTFDPRNPFAAAARFPPLRFDHVFSGWPKPHAIGHPAHAELIGHVPVDGVYGSDHYGVMADLHY